MRRVAEQLARGTHRHVAECGGSWRGLALSRGSVLSSHVHGMFRHSSEDLTYPVDVFLKYGKRVRKVTLALDMREPEYVCSVFKIQFRDEPAITRDADPSRLYIIGKDRKTEHQYVSPTLVFQKCVIELKCSPASGISSTSSPSLLVDLQKERMVFVMVGLPASGKTMIARKMGRYLQWLGIPSRVFNVADYRRKRLGVQPSTFFRADNREGEKARLHMFVAALDDIVEWLLESGKVAILDGSHTTASRRQLVLSRCQAENFRVLFVQTDITDPGIQEQNIAETVHCSPEYLLSRYQKLEASEASAILRSKIEEYRRTYESQLETHLSWVRITDMGRQQQSNNVTSYLSCRVVFYLMSLHNNPQPIWFVRHGESVASASGRIGTDDGLTGAGEMYAQSLGDFVAEQLPENVVVWTSTLQRAVESCRYILKPKMMLKQLDEIDAGDCDGMTYREIELQMPHIAAARAADKLRYRYPRGESYEDVIQRLEPLIFELERQVVPVLIVGHQATLRCIYAYFMDFPRDSVPFVDIPPNKVIKLTPSALACRAEAIEPCKHCPKSEEDNLPY